MMLINLYGGPHDEQEIQCAQAPSHAKGGRPRMPDRQALGGHLVHAANRHPIEKTLEPCSSVAMTSVILRPLVRKRSLSIVHVLWLGA